MDEITNISENNITDNIDKLVIEDASRGIYYCFLCGAPLDIDKRCTDLECPLYGIPQG